MDPNISKATTGKERVVTTCAELQSTSRGPNRTRFLAVQTAIRVKMKCDKKSLLPKTDAARMSREGTDYADEVTEPIRRNSI
jgi:hypothetical protein